VGMEWLGLGAGRRELKELKKATIDKRIFIKIRVCMREGKVVFLYFLIHVCDFRTRLFSKANRAVDRKQ